MYKITTEVSAKERDLIIAGIESAAKLAEEQLVHAAQAGLSNDTINERAEIVHNLQQVKFSFGWNHDYKSIEEDEQI